jgi:hypothetical protein
MAEIFQALGLLPLSQEDEAAEVQQGAPAQRSLRLVK